MGSNNRRVKRNVFEWVREWRPLGMFVRTLKNIKSMHGRMLLLLAVLGCGGDNASQSVDRAFSLRVICEPGTTFRGSLQVTHATGASTSADASGACPANGWMSFSTTGIVVSAAVQKQEERGVLIVQILNQFGNPVARSETRDPYGMAVAASP